VALFGALRNLDGYTTPTLLSTMGWFHSASRGRIVFGRDGVLPEANDGGTLVLGTQQSTRVQYSYVFHPRNSRDIWEPLRENLALENADLGEFVGQLGNVGDSAEAQLRRGLPLGALCQTTTIAPKASVTLGFILAWHFPHFAERDYHPRKLHGEIIGHRYAEWFTDAEEVFDYGVQRYARLRSQTRAFVRAYYEGTYPRWFLDAVAAQFTTLVKSSWWDRSGRFGIWEGLGCCGLQTTDITYYGSFPVVQFFPDLQMSQMRLTRDNMETQGKIPHMMPGSFSCCDVDTRGRIDLIPQFILLVWRDVLWTDDLVYAADMWPTVQDALAFFETFDTDGDGLPNNSGPDQTYDQFPLKGTSSFVGFLYAASLRAATDLAELLGHTDRAQELRARRAKVLTDLDEQLWNGDYYRLCHEQQTGVSDEGVMADQINADWFIRQTTGEGLLDATRVRSCLRAILTHCATPPGFIANCAWPMGGAVTIGRHTADQANWPWSGVEYTLAAHLILAGMSTRGLAVARDVWRRYERAGLRFNHIECGGHYYRALSSWAAYLALSGFALDAARQRISFVVGKRRERFVVCTPTGWGTAETGSRRAVLSLDIAEGKLKVRSISLAGYPPGRPHVRVSGRLVAATVERSGTRTVVSLRRAVTLRPGAPLSIGG
jgi:non-lysosomal glucosylceramidase